MSSSLLPELGPVGGRTHTAIWTEPPAWRSHGFWLLSSGQGNRPRSQMLIWALGQSLQVVFFFFLFLRGPWPLVTDYHHHQCYLKGVSWMSEGSVAGQVTWVCCACHSSLHVPETTVWKAVWTELHTLQKMLGWTPYLCTANSVHGESLFKYISLSELSSSFMACCKTSWTSISTFDIYFGSSFLS